MRGQLQRLLGEHFGDPERQRATAEQIQAYQEAHAADGLLAAPLGYTLVPIPLGMESPLGVGRAISEITREDEGEGRTKTE